MATIFEICFRTCCGYALMGLGLLFRRKGGDGSCGSFETKKCFPTLLRTSSEDKLSDKVLAGLATEHMEHQLMENLEN
jgi:hypothetical protein